MTISTVTRTLTPTAPFDFQKSLAFLGEFTPAKGEQNLTAGTLTKATRLHGQTLAFRVQAAAGSTPDQPALTCELFAPETPTPEVEAAALERVGQFLSLNDNLPAFYARAADDPAFQPVIRGLYGYHQVKFLTPFENAVWTILSAHNRLPVAQQMKKRLIETYGGAITVDGTEYGAFPEPEDLRNATLTDLAEVVGNERRAGYLMAAVEAFDQVDPDWLRTAPSADIRTWLLSIKGIGVWSASFVLIRALGRMDVLDVPEARLIEAAARVYGRRLDGDVVLTLVAGYGDFRGYWAHYLRAYSA